MQTHTADAVYLAACECRTPLGDAAATRRALCEGAVALKPVKVAGIDGEPELPLSLFAPLGEPDPPRWLKACRDLVGALPDRPWGGARHPVLVSSSNFGIEQLLAYYQGGNSALHCYATPGTVVETVADACGFGPNLTVVSNACVSAQLAIGEGGALLRAGLADEVLILSFDFLSPFVIGGFAALKILNGNPPKPYQDTDTGSIGLGEGLAAAVLSLRRAEFQIIDTVAHQESHHMTANDPSGAGFAMIAERLRALAPGARFWLKGHGTGTLDAGRLEAQTLERAFPSSPLVSWKGSLGHTLGSCGLVEMAVALEAMRGGESPGTPGARAPFFAGNVAANAFATGPFDGVALFSSAFGGAHSATLVQYA